jgi:predicted acyl esterase
MHRTSSGDRRQALQRDARELAKDARILQKVARAPAARKEAERLQGEAEAALAEAEALKLQARLEDLNVWQMEKVKQSRKGSKTYTYWMASWREDGKTHNVLPGGQQKDGWRGCQPGGQGEEGGGAGDNGHVIED